MELQDDIRKKLREALEKASTETSKEIKAMREANVVATTTGCCEIRIGTEVRERRGGITEKRCNDIADLFGGIPNFQRGVDC